MIALMALSSTFVSCSDSDDDTDNAEQAKAIAGTYKGYSIGESKMFSDYLMGPDAVHHYSQFGWYYQSGI